MRTRIAAAAVVGLLVSALAPMTAPTSAAAAAAAASAAGTGGGSVQADFNHDGVADLAIGVPGENVGAGAVNVIYGSAAAGLRAAGNQFWTQDSPGVPDQAEKGDGFGWALAAGDFNGDGFSDLAIGVPYEDLGAADVGAVQILYGSAKGLTASHNQFLTQDSLDTGDVGEAYDRFGSSLAAGNLGRSTQDDLAIGVPEEDSEAGSGAYNSGEVDVTYGSSFGLAAGGNDVWRADSPGMPGKAADFAEFGFNLAISNFGRSNYADLAVSAPFVGGGGVYVIYGDENGLSSTGIQFWSQNSPGIADQSESDDEFGHTLAAGNLGRSPYADLAIGVPLEGLGKGLKQGAVEVIYGTPDGLDAAGSQFWTQDSPGILDKAETADEFGAALAIGDFGKSTYQDLAVGVPQEGITSRGNGAVNVIYGSPSGLTAAGNQLWTQDSPGILDKAERSDAFGASLTAANFGHSKHADLAIGVPLESTKATDSGAVNVIYGSAAGLTSAGNQFWTQDSPGIADKEEFDDQFGGSLGGSGQF